MKPLETQEDIVNYFGSPLEEPELNPDIYFKPYKSKTDDLINKILAKRSGGSHSLSSFTLLDSSVITPPVIDNFKTAYYQKVIEYGDFVDVYIYEKPIIKAKNRKSKTYSHCGGREKVDNSSKYRRRNSIRALNLIRQLSILNFSGENTKLLTLTFGKCDFDIKNPKICNKKLSNFLQELRGLFPNYMYLAVLEFQKRGAVHYHILCDLPFIDKEKLANLWGYGFIDIRKPGFLAVNYLSKYLEKSLFDERLKGVRVFFHSKNLQKPKEYTGLSAFNKLQEIQNANIVFANHYHNKYNDEEVLYRQLKNSPAQNKNDQ
ncbi:hypothetical protein GYA27_04305 [candidate division WWE3 bacterium]|uniref:Replication-associated protein ORF2/G2P domain-containing protein n=1 Tax=candidate division WWE3 bacterium TaxID=2053526 RepID=A0A7X9DL12_UNCKA|nr:hypothetical protein [candidate division WWE3 bacterium]